MSGFADENTKVSRIEMIIVIKTKDGLGDNVF
jgi:hypothetical protein